MSGGSKSAPTKIWTASNIITITRIMLVPVFVGAMDTSIARVKQRIAPLEDLDIAGLVFTTPFYSVPKRDQIMNFYREVAKLTKHNILAYVVSFTSFSCIPCNPTPSIIKVITPI